MKRKKIYIINVTHLDGSVTKEQVCGGDFYAAVRESNANPPEQRRYFIEDKFLYDGEVDSVIIESTREEYLAWRREKRVAEENFKGFFMKYEFISIEAMAEREYQFENIRDSGPDSPVRNEEEAAVMRMFLEYLNDKAEAWKPWAADMLKQYLYEGIRDRDFAAIVAARRNVSKRMGRNYRAQFDEFLRNIWEEWA